MRAQNKLMASGGKPRRLNAVNVYRRGSSQSLYVKKMRSTISSRSSSYLTTPS